MLVLAAIVLFAWHHELRPAQPGALATSQRPEPRALSAEEESYAAALWEIHREVTPSAVAMSFAGIVYDGFGLERLRSPPLSHGTARELRKKQAILQREIAGQR